MNKYPLIGVSILAVVLLVLGSLTNVAGYQTIQSSNQQVINKEVNQKELLFQTIVDIANNKEIQRIILKSQINRDGFLNPDVRFSIFNSPILMKNQLKQMYFIGLFFSKVVSKIKMQSMIHRYQFINPGMQGEISAVIEKDVKLDRKITQLSNLQCDCEDMDITRWSFPIICRLLVPLFIVSVILFCITYNYYFLIVLQIGYILNCDWAG
jgi:hypothetical protein